MFHVPCSMELIDTHTHLNFKAFSKDYKEVIKRTLDENIWMIIVSSNFATSKRAVEIAEEYEEGVYPAPDSRCRVYAAIGLHPIHVQDEEFDVSKYRKLAQSPRVVAIGETGLDYYHIDNSPSSKFKVQNSKLQFKIKNLQKNIFVKHLGLAREIDKPLIIHCREAHKDLIDLLKEQESQNALPRRKGVVHCFMGKWSEAQEYLKMGFLISFTGVITYVKDYDKAILNISLEKLMLDTDSPYMAPEPHRGQRNEPRYCKYIAQKIAEVKGVSFEEVAKVTTENARKLFNLT